MEWLLCSFADAKTNEPKHCTETLSETLSETFTCRYAQRVPEVFNEGEVQCNVFAVVISNLSERLWLEEPPPVRLSVGLSVGLSPEGTTTGPHRHAPIA